MKIRPAILIVEEGKILTMQYHYGGEDVFNLPGGNVEIGESLIETLEREMLEELKIKVRVGNLMMLGEVQNEVKKNLTLHCIFQGEIIDGLPVLNPNETSALSIKWLNINELHTFNMYPNVGVFIQKSLNNNLDDLYLGKIQQKWF